MQPFVAAIESDKSAVPGVPRRPARLVSSREDKITTHDQRTASRYIFSAICFKDAALVLPRRNTSAMTLRQAEVTATVEDRNQSA